MPSSPGGQYINAAQRATIARDPACATPVNRGAAFAHGSPGPALLSVLGVLRRPAALADGTTRTLLRNGFDAGAGVYINYIRRARSEFGKSFYIIPEARITPFGPIPTRCYAEMHAALGRALRKVPLAQRAQIIRAQSEQFAAQRQESLHRGGVCFAVVTIGQRVSPGGVDMGCSPGVPDIHQGGMSGWIGEDHPAGGVLLAGIVPDGVATITLHYPAANREPARTITASVINNVAVFEVPPHTAHQDSPQNVVWRTADGHAINQTTHGR